LTQPDVLGGFSVLSSWCVLNREETTPVSPELEPEVIEEDGGDDPHSFAFIPQQIEADWHEKWGPLL
jgi:hypothetical protein